MPVSAATGPPCSDGTFAHVWELTSGAWAEGCCRRCGQTRQFVPVMPAVKPSKIPDLLSERRGRGGPRLPEGPSAA